MKWRKVKSKDVIDVRGASPPKGSRSASAGGSAGLPIPGGIAGIGGGAGVVVVIVIVAIQLFSGGAAAARGE